MTLIRYVDGPWEGTTVETNMTVIEGVHEHGDGTASHVTYAVDRATFTATFRGYGDRFDVATGRGVISIPDLDEHAVDEEPLLSEATDAQLRAELERRGYRPRLTTPMRRRRRDMPRAGFGQRWPQE